MRVCLALLGALAGCATAQPQPPAQHFTGNPYDVTMRHGVMAGQACAVDINYAVSRRGDATVLLGPGTRRLEVRGEGGMSHVTGVLSGNIVGNPTIDLWISPERISGRLRARIVELVADGDRYRGFYVLPGTSASERGDMEVAGRAEMLQLPRAALAAIVPPLLSCDRRTWSKSPASALEPPITVAFGGPAHYETSTAR
jgi:hypothetical protein